MRLGPNETQGFGGTRAPSLGEVMRGDAAAPYTLIDMVDDTACLLDALEIERAHILGISMGGMIAQIFAERHAGRTRSLISFMSTSGAPGLPGPTQDAMAALLSQPTDPTNRESIIEHAMQSRRVVEGPKLRDTDEELRAELAAATDRAHNPAGIGRQMAAIAASGARESGLVRIEAPTLVMHGDADPLVPLEAGRDTAVRIPGARLEVIEGLGHSIPRRFATRLAGLVAGHCRQADRR